MGLCVLGKSPFSVSSVLSLRVCVCVVLYPVIWVRGSASLLAGPPSRNSSSCIHQSNVEDALLQGCWALVVRKEESHVPASPGFHCSSKSPHATMVKFLAGSYLALVPKS